MIKNELDAVQAFHEAFKIGVNQKPTIEVSDKIKELRFNLMKEENEEYLEAVQNNDLVEVADALGDMLYILCELFLPMECSIKSLKFSKKYSVLI